VSSNRLQRASHRTASAQLQTSYRKKHDSLNLTFIIELLWAAKCNVITDTTSCTVAYAGLFVLAGRQFVDEQGKVYACSVFVGEPASLASGWIMLAVRQCPTWKVVSGAFARQACAFDAFTSLSVPEALDDAASLAGRQTDELTTCAHRPWSCKLRRMKGLQVVVPLLAWEP
jgi:hypothetical protein